MTGRQVGAVHSRYCVRHSHVIFVAARRAAQLAALKRDLRFAQAKFRLKNKDDYKTKYELDDAMEYDNTVSDFQDQIAKLDAEKQLLDAIALGYDDLKAAASRELFRRSSENAGQ